jgi:hypothetical protein
LNPYNRVADARNVILQLVDAEAWRDIQAALSISLAELSAKQAGSAMVVSPVFGPPEPQRTTAPQSPDVLVLMPFVAEMALLYNEIRSVALRCNASVARADEFSGQGIVMQDTWTAICHAKLIVADCTGRNPNVFYEIGLAHAVGTPVLLIAQDVTDIPFDIQHHRVIPYRRDDLRSFRNTLEVNIRAELDDTSRDL